ncbi:10003_t:CDS:2, partial [Racocetra persica]
PIRLPSYEFRNLSFLPDPIPSKGSIPKYVLVAEKIYDYIDCKNCRKCRYIYSNKSLTNDEQQDYQQALESYSYSCGALIFPDDHYLKK